VGGGESISQHSRPVDIVARGHRVVCSSDFDGSLEESRDDLQSLGYDMPVPLICSDSYTNLLDTTESAATPALRDAARAVLCRHYEWWTTLELLAPVKRGCYDSEPREKYDTIAIVREVSSPFQMKPGRQLY
jgi:hypothetical protein